MARNSVFFLYDKSFVSSFNFIFKGNFKYADGERNFLGTIRQNNRTFYWVSPESKGYIHGEILNNNTIEVCYTEAYKGAAVGCSILKRIKK